MAVSYLSPCRDPANGKAPNVALMQRIPPADKIVAYFDFVFKVRLKCTELLDLYSAAAAHIHARVRCKMSTLLASLLCNMLQERTCRQEPFFWHHSQTMTTGLLQPACSPL